MKYSEEEKRTTPCTALIGQIESDSFQKNRKNSRIVRIMPVVPATLQLVTAYVALPQFKINMVSKLII